MRATATVGAAPAPTPAHIGIAHEGDLTPGMMIGEYRVEGKLGEGGMATVFAALHPLIGKRVAIKVISRRLCSDLHAVERFINEARTVNQIGHPNLVDIFAFGVLPDGRTYLVMEWLPGETLAARLAREPLPLALAFDILAQLVDALEAAHEMGVVHRDLKPQNIFILERNGAVRVKLLDFGIAKLADSDVSTPKTRSGVAMGTAGYMSPEQARGKNVDHRTDLYALGCVAYEMLLGRLPFVADTAIDILAMHLAATPPSPRAVWPQIPAELERGLLELLDKEPDRRPSLVEFRRVLHSAMRSLHPGAELPDYSHVGLPSRRWLPILFGAGAGVAILAAAMNGYFDGRRSGTAVRPLAKQVTRSVGGVGTIAPPAEPVRPAAALLPAPAAAVVRPPPAEEPSGTLVVRAKSGARVTIDGHDYVVGAEPLRLKMPVGGHLVTGAGRRHQLVSEWVRVTSGATAELKLPGTAREGSSPSPSPASEVTKEAESPRPEATKPEPAKANDGSDYTLNPF